MQQRPSAVPAIRLPRSPLLRGMVALAMVLLIARIASPHVLQWYVNAKLDESPQYAGQVGDIDLAILRGAYTIEHIEISKTEGDVPVPLFAVSKVEFTTLWRALLNGTAVAQAVLYDPQINIVDSADETRKQTGQGGQWLQMIDALFPLPLDRAVVHNGQLHFRNYDSDPKIDISLSNMHLVAENLANQQALTNSSIATVEITALAMDVADLAVAAAYDPTTSAPTFDADLNLRALPVLKLDNFISTYAPFDVEAGTLDVTSELAAREGRLTGYVQPTVHNLEVFRWSEDIGKDKDNPLHALWEGLVELVAGLQTQPHDKLVSTIPLHGDISATDSNLFVAIAGVVKDAFADAYQVNLKNTVSLLSADEPETAALPPPLEASAR